MGKIFIDQSGRLFTKYVNTGFGPVKVSKYWEDALIQSISADYYLQLVIDSFD